MFPVFLSTSQQRMFLETFPFAKGVRFHYNILSRIHKNNKWINEEIEGYIVYLKFDMLKDVSSSWASLNKVEGVTKDNKQCYYFISKEE